MKLHHFWSVPLLDVVENVLPASPLVLKASVCGVFHPFSVMLPMSVLLLFSATIPTSAALIHPIAVLESGAIQVKVVTVTHS